MPYELKPIRLSDIYEHPSGIPAAHLITGSPYTVKGWGDDVNFYERTELRITPK